MRKKLFLTLALLVASFATVNAQWSQTLSAIDGFTGVVDSNSGCKTVKTGLIKPSAPIEGLRITFVKSGSTAENHINLGTPMVALSEVKVLDSEGNNVAYTPSSNSVQDNEGSLPSIADGNYDTYYHSFWGSGINDRVEGEYVYVELAFEQPVSAFRLMLAAGKNHAHMCPEIAVLTPAGVVGVPAELGELPEGEFELGERLTTMDELLAAEYFAIRGNTPKTYTKDKTDYEWIGARFITGTGNYNWVAEDSTHLYGPNMAAQLIEGAVEGTYYIYWPKYNAYIGDYGKIDPNRGGLATVTGPNSEFWQDWQVGSSSVEAAADLMIAATADGQFTLAYETTLGDANKTPTVAYIAAEPRDEENRPFKVFNGDLRAQLKSGNYDSGYSLPVGFEFDFFACTYIAPEYLAQAELNGFLFDAANVVASYGGRQDSEDYLGEAFYDNLVQAITDAQSLIDGGAGNDELNAQIEVVKEAIIGYLYSVSYQKYDEVDYLYDQLSEEGLFCTNDALEVGKYTEESFDAILRPIQGTMETLASDYESFGAIYDYYGSYLTAFADYDAALKEFYAGKVVATPWPVTFTTADGLPATAANVWRSPMIRPDFNGLNGFRITFLENANDDIKFGYPLAILAELCVRDADGNVIPLTEANISTNSLEPTEGSIASLFDGDIETFYHSQWSGSLSLDNYVYLDVELPDTYVGITVEWIARQNNWPCSPRKVCVGPYGETYDPIAESENPYNVAVGAQVTEASQIQDWGLYAIKGLLDTNAEILSEDELGNERWFTGVVPFHTSVVREDCAYFFVKNSDGTFNILNLKSSKFWGDAPGDGSDAKEVNTTSEAADINIVKSTHAAYTNTFVLYSSLPDTTKLSASFEYADSATETEITVEAVDVITKYNVFMDWGNRVAQRYCVDPQPGIADVSVWGEQAENVELVDEYFQAKGAAGDYLHFNKTNGEGEWKIYRLTMDNPYYYWLTSLVGIAEDMGITEGINPGQFKDTGDFADDYAAAQAVIDATNYAGAEAAAKKLATTLESTTAGTLERNPITEGTYIFEAAHSGYGGRKAMYVKTLDDGTHDLAWGNKPADYTTDEGKTYLFTLETVPYIDDLIADNVVTEEMRDCVYFIKSVATGEYVQTYTGDPSYSYSFTSDNQGAVPYIFRRGTTDIYTINTDGQGHMHTEGHGGGTGNAGDIVTWNGTPDNTSASAWRLITYIEETTITGDLNADGEVSVGDLAILVGMVLDPSLATDAADLNADSEVSVGDLTILVSMILGTDTASEAPAKAAATRAAALSTISAEGDGSDLIINVTNPDFPFTAIQFDIYFPEGLEISGVEEDGVYYYDAFVGSR
ncbi:MAG: dockerin type I repeat-containing protein, partial [Bacteroidaceae bacterium]|nr:dockerin type I repeat-containing protein [Bacteroidaceae bacterium]